MRDIVVAYADIEGVIDVGSHIPDDCFELGRGHRDEVDRALDEHSIHYGPNTIETVPHFQNARTHKERINCMARFAEHLKEVL